MNEPQITPATERPSETPARSDLSTESISQPHTDDEQAEYLAAYRLQLRRLACPGCGDGDPIF